MAHTKIIISAACLVAELTVASLYEPPKAQNTVSHSYNAPQEESAISQSDSITHAEHQADATSMTQTLPVR